MNSLFPTSPRRVGVNVVREDGLVQRNVPKIGGSVGGFIALVVFLILIILASCTAIFFLLRDHSQHDEERARRRPSRYQPASNPSSADQSWSTKLGTMFGFGSKPKDRAKTGRGGWIRASSDEWEYDSDEDRHLAGGELAEMSKPTSYSPPRDRPFRPPIDQYSPPESSTAVHFDPYGGPGRHYSKGRSPSSHSHMPSIHSRLSEDDSSSTFHIPRTASPDASGAAQEPSGGAGRQFSTQSGSSMRTQDGGTKFIERI